MSFEESPDHSPRIIKDELGEISYVRKEAKKDTGRARIKKN